MQREQHRGCQPWSDPHMNVGFVIKSLEESIMLVLLLSSAPWPGTLDDDLQPAFTRSSRTHKWMSALSHYYHYFPEDYIGMHNNNNNSFVTKRVFLSCDCELYIGRRMWTPIFPQRKESMCTRRTLLSRSKLGLTEAASLHAIIEQAQKEALKHKDEGRIHPSQEGTPGIDSKPWKICNGLPRSFIFLVNLLICWLAESQFAVTM